MSPVQRAGGANPAHWWSVVDVTKTYVCGTCRLGASLPYLFLLLILISSADSLTLYVLRGHTSTVRCLKVIHNRPIAVSGSRDGTLRVWDVQRGRMLRVLAGHAGSVRSLDVCANQVVSGSYDGTCRVRIKLHKHMNGCALMALTGGQLWDVDTGDCLQVFRGHFNQIYAVAFDGKIVASGGLDTTVRVWDVHTGYANENTLHPLATNLEPIFTDTALRCFKAILR
jgi:WD40 repeat protein